MRLVLAGVVLLVVKSPAAAQPARAELVCAATATVLVYDCTVRLSRGGQPLDGVEIVAGADMPSMPMTHNVRQVAAAPGPAPGEYKLRLTLEMLGEWTVKLRLSGPVRDQLILHYDFDRTGASRVGR